MKSIWDREITAYSSNKGTGSAIPADPDTDVLQLISVFVHVGPSLNHREQTAYQSGSLY
jgi:hypothetical protein